MIHCNAEWHLRENQRAYLIYTIALRIAKGTGSFFVSQPRLAEFFGWDLKTVRAAFKALRDSGLLTLLRGGRGGDGQASFANVYSVTTHAKLSKFEHPCRPLPETGTLTNKAEDRSQGKNRYPIPETGTGGLPETGRGGLPETGILIYKRSTRESTNSEAVASKNQPSATPGKHTYFPSTFAPNDDNRANAQKLRLNLEQELIAFKEFHLSKGNRFIDWHFALNTWLRNARKFSPERPAAPVTTGSLTQNYRDLIERSNK
jgi:hypothetical protein